MLKSLKFILSSILIISLYNCGGGPTKEQKEVIDAQAQLEKDLEMYRYVWGEFFKGDTSIVNEKYFTEDVTVVTPEGDLIGIEAVKNHYLNFFIGFSNVEFTIVDANGRLQIPTSMLSNIGIQERAIVEEIDGKITISRILSE